MFKSFFKIFTGNIIGKIIGFLREIIIAYLYGTSVPVGAFRIAQTAVLIPVNFFTSDTLNAGFIPLYNHYKKISIYKAQSFFWILNIALTLISFIIVIILFKSAFWWVNLIAPGFSVAEHNLAVLFVKIMSLSIPFYVLSLLYSYLALAHNYSFLVSIRPSIQSFGMICGAILAYYFNNIALFAWGFTGAYIFFFFLAIKELLKKNLFYFSFQNIGEILKDFFNIIKPLLLLPIMLQGNIFIERMVSSYMGIDVVASVEYAKFITESGISLLAAPLGLIGLATLSNFNMKKTRDKLLQIISLILIITIPISMFLISNSELIVSFIFKRGAFDKESVLITKNILIGLSIGFWAQIVSYIMIKALNAQHENKKVVIFMAIALSSNTLFDIFFYKILGPITIGIGSSIYGFILFILTINFFNISRYLLNIIFWLLIGSVIYFFINNFLYFKNEFIDIFITFFLFLLYWAIYIFIIPILRNNIISILKGKK
ncbi:putative peptidoglycan lipid II flippase [Lebetimonas natsushimae]|uniref:Putative peptidoglycan lipid II flippase n=1 Tax=Lebetimonas natsushimae TaxID=1936991 RepID=A0A292YBG9_9BACT|nr:lipid II flippase MurJ [Lebetimonas natsushimae]GAX86873.1 putative peptidoglycan lipid II flippase [Lebetimonas natsushimae]